VLQHPADDTVGATTMLRDLFEIAGQHPDRLDNLGAFVGIERANRLRSCLLDLVEQLDRKAGEVVHEIEGFLISCAMPAVS
jgi:hypothetical protein